MYKALPKSRLPRQLAVLNRISSGSAAVALPKNVASVALAFKFQNCNGHMGPRKFWQTCLPQVQFNNPSVPISVSRVWASSKTDHADIPATLTVNFTDGSSKSVNVQHKHSDAILAEFISLANATPIPVDQQVILKNKDESDMYSASR